MKCFQWQTGHKLHFEEKENKYSCLFIQHTTLRQYSAQKESLHIPLGYKSNRLIRKKQWWA